MNKIINISIVLLLFPAAKVVANQYTEEEAIRCHEAIKNYKMMIKVQEGREMLKESGVEPKYDIPSISFPYSIEQVDEMLKSKHDCEVSKIVADAHAKSLVR